MLDTPRSHKLQPRVPGAGARAVLFGYLLRSGARDKAAVILERLDAESVGKLVSLLEGEELRQMAALCFSEAHVGRAVALDVPSLVRLCRSGDHYDVERCMRRLPTEIVRRILPALPDEQRRSLERSIERTPRTSLGGGAAGQRAERFWAALRLRRLFQR